MSDIVVRQPDPEPHERSGALIVQQANEVTVTSLDEREHAGMFSSQIGSEIKAIELEFDGTEEKPGPCQLLYRGWKSVVSLRERATAARKEAKVIIDGRIKRFEFDVEQKRLAEARKAESIARQKAEDERARQILEAKRLGDREAVQNLKQAPISVVTPPPKTPEIPKTEGMRRSSPIWDFEVTDPNKVPRRYYILDEVAIRKVVKALGPKHGIPGINVFDARSRG